jgi:flagellin
MDSDVAGFEAINDSLGLGQATTGVALAAAENITDLLTEIKGKIVNSQEENVDRAKIQTDIVELRNQIGGIVGAAQFNGLNVLKNDSTVEGSGTVNILSSLDRAGDGSVASSTIDFRKQDLDTRAAVFGSTAVTAGDLITLSNASVAAAGGTQTISFTADGAAAGSSYRITVTGVGANELGTATQTFEYVAADGDTELDVSTNLLGQINDFITEQVPTGTPTTVVTQDATTGALTVTNNDPTAADTITLTVAEFSGGTSGGGLADLADIDVSTADGATSALASIEGLIQRSIDSAAVLGSAAKRIDTQTDFVGKLIDGLKSGIGTLVDADMEAASARLQALQTQQQLGVQALSIANQAPQTILSLFR